MREIVMILIGIVMNIVLFQNSIMAQTRIPFQIEGEAWLVKSKDKTETE